MSATERLPWERQRNESHQAYSAFCAYRDQADARSLQQVARELGKGLSLLKRWSVRWHWQDRLAAWQNELTRRRLNEEVEAQREMINRHARLAGATLSRVAQRLVGDDVHGVTQLDPGSLTAADIARLLDVGVRVERLSRGAPTEHTELSGQVNAEAHPLEDLSDEELDERIAHLQRRLGGNE